MACSKPWLALLIAGYLGSSALLAAGDPQATVGTPGSDSKLPGEILAAYEAGARDITIRPGIYLLANTGKPTLEWVGWKAARVRAEGVTLIFQGLANRPLRLKNCSEVTLEGATLRFAHPAATQGRIVAMSQEKEFPWLEWQVDAGYRCDLDLSHASFDVVDGATRLLKAGTGDVSFRHVEMVGPGRFRFSSPSGLLGTAGVNDWLFTRVASHSSLVEITQSERCVMRRVVLQNAGFAAFFETGGGGGHLYQACRVMPGPMPQGATQEQLVGGGADGFHSSGMSQGPTIDGCSWEGVFHDDCIAIHGSFQEILKIEGSRLLLEPYNRGAFAPGDPVRISTKEGAWGEYRCTAVKPLKRQVEMMSLKLQSTSSRDLLTLTVPASLMASPAANEVVKLLGPQGELKRYACRQVQKKLQSEEFLEVTLDREPAVELPAKASNPRRNGAGFKILNSTMGNTRSRGILVKGDNGLIEGNTISGCGMSAISVGPEYWWNESDYVRGLVIRNNHLSHNELNGGHAGTIYVHGDGAMANADITITANRLEGIEGEYGIYVEYAQGVRIEGNQVAMQAPTGKPRAVVSVSHVQNVALKQNRVEGLNAGDRLLKKGPDCSGIEGEGELQVMPTR